MMKWQRTDQVWPMVRPLSVPWPDIRRFRPLSLHTWCDVVSELDQAQLIADHIMSSCSSFSTHRVENEWDCRGSSFIRLIQLDEPDRGDDLSMRPMVWGQTKRPVWCLTNGQAPATCSDHSLYISLDILLRYQGNISRMISILFSFSGHMFQNIGTFSQ